MIRLFKLDAFVKFSIYFSLLFDEKQKPLSGVHLHMLTNENFTGLYKLLLFISPIIAAFRLYVQTGSVLGFADFMGDFSVQSNTMTVVSLAH